MPFSSPMSQYLRSLPLKWFLICRRVELSAEEPCDALHRTFQLLRLLLSLTTSIPHPLVDIFKELIEDSSLGWAQPVKEFLRKCKVLSQDLQRPCKSFMFSVVSLGRQEQGRQLSEGRWLACLI